MVELDRVASSFDADTVMPLARYFRFRLRTLLLLAAVLSVGLAWWVSGDRIPRDWDLPAIYEAANLNPGKSFLLAWCIEADERPLLVERCIVLQHVPASYGEELWFVCELYRHPQSAAPTWQQSMTHLGPCANDPVGHWERHSRKLNKAPTNDNVYKALDDIGWKFGPSSADFKIIDAGVCARTWQRAIHERPTRQFESR